MKISSGPTRGIAASAVGGARLAAVGLALALWATACTGTDDPEPGVSAPAASPTDTDTDTDTDTSSGDDVESPDPSQDPAPDDLPAPVAARPAPAIVVGPVTGNTGAPGRTASFTVALTTQPAAPVTISVSSSDSGQGEVDVTQLTFDPEDWFNAQSVSVTGAPGATDDQDYAVELGAASSEDPDYSGLDADDVAMRGPVLEIAPPDDLGPLLANHPNTFSADVTYTGTATLSFQLANQPDGMAIDLSSGVISWTPTDADAGTTVGIDVRVGDGSRFADTTIDVSIAALEPLDTTVSGNTLEIVDAGSDLAGTTITQTGGEDVLTDLSLGVVDLDQLPDLPAEVIALTDVLAAGSPVSGDLVVRLPLPDLPEGAFIGDVGLYALTDQQAPAENALLPSRAAFVLRWDTTGTDVDIYATAKDDTTLWYQNRNAGTGNLDVDNTTGFGPEVITYRATDDVGDAYVDGTFAIDVHYYNGSLPTNFTLDVILNETDGPNRRVLRYASVAPLTTSSPSENGPTGAGTSRLNDILRVTCNAQSVCSLGSAPDAALRLVAGG